MTADADPRDELQAAIDGLSDAQVHTLAGWARTLHRDREAQATEHSVGALGDLLGIVSETREQGRATMRVEGDPALMNPNGVLHGGVIYTAVDYCMGGAVQHSLPEGQFCTTIEVKIYYLAPVRGGTLRVNTEVVKLGRNIAFTESKVLDEDDKLVATASGSMFILRPQE